MSWSDDVTYNEANGPRDPHPKSWLASCPWDDAATSSHIELTEPADVREPNRPGWHRARHPHLPEPNVPA